MVLIKVRVKSILKCMFWVCHTIEKCVISHPSKFECLKKPASKNISSILCSRGVSTRGAEATPTRGKAAVSLSTVVLCSLFKKETKLFCKWSQPGIIRLCDKGIASKQTVETNSNSRLSREPLMLCALVIRCVWLEATLQNDQCITRERFKSVCSL